MPQRGAVFAVPEEVLDAGAVPVPVLEAVTLPPDARDLDRWAAGHGRDPEMVQRLNPAFAGGHIAPRQRPVQVLAPLGADVVTAVADAAAPAAETRVADVDPQPPAEAAVPPETPVAAVAAAPRPARTHVVGRGESLWTIARRYKLQVADLLSRNALAPRVVLHPGMVLQLDGDLGE